jgi:hypothetical protein
MAAEVWPTWQGHNCVCLMFVFATDTPEVLHQRHQHVTIAKGQGCALECTTGCKLALSNHGLSTVIQTVTSASCRYLSESAVIHAQFGARA